MNKHFTILSVACFVLAACSPSAEEIKTILNAHIAGLGEDGSTQITNVEKTEKSLYSGTYSVSKDSLTTYVYPFTAIIKKDQVTQFFKDTDEKNVKVVTKKTCAGAQTNSNHYFIDATEINNTTKFNVVRWSVNYACSKLDQWFSEKAGLITDNMSWTRGNNEQNGYFTFHRFNRDSYTCNFVRTSSTMGSDGYGDNTSFSKRDAPYSSLRRDGDYYVLDLREFTGYVPLYLPFSETHNKSVWRKGVLVFEWIGDDDSDLSIHEADLLVETKLEYDERIKKEEEQRLAEEKEKARKAAAAAAKNNRFDGVWVSSAGKWVFRLYSNETADIQLGDIASYKTNWTVEGGRAFIGGTGQTRAWILTRDGEVYDLSRSGVISRTNGIRMHKQ